MIKYDLQIAKNFDLDFKIPNYFMANVCVRNRSSVSANFYGFRYKNYFYRNICMITNLINWNWLFLVLPNQTQTGLVLVRLWFLLFLTGWWYYFDKSILRRLCYAKWLLSWHRVINYHLSSCIWLYNICWLHTAIIINSTFIYILCVHWWSVIHGIAKMYDLHSK